jgi:uncharacterized protein
MTPTRRGMLGTRSVGSVIGALGGGLLVGMIPASLLTMGLGILLIISAIRTLQHRQPA